MFRVEGVWLPFGIEEVGRGLQGIDLTVAPGQVAAVLGPNGAGKSMLLSCIAGLRTPQKGRVVVGSHDVTHLSSHDRAPFVCLMSQDKGIGLPMRMTIGEVLALWAQRFGHLWSSVRPRRHAIVLNKALSKYLPHLGDRLDDQVLTLSGGELQLLSLACLELALKEANVDDRVLLMDEHVASLDPILTQEVMERSCDLIRSQHLCGVLVTHSVELALSFAETINILVEGRIVLRSNVGNLRAEHGDHTRAFLIQMMRLPNATSDSPETPNEIADSESQTHAHRQ